MKKVFLAVLVMSFSIFSQDAYRIYDSNGNAATMEQIMEAAGKNDVVFLGENHDDVTAHGLQFEIFKKAIEKYSADRKVALSLEMFERDVQVVLNEYLAGQITESHFLSSSRPWGNYKGDYRPLVELAKEKKLEVIAANAPRRYVNMVSRNGRDALNALSPEAKKWLAPLPFGMPSEAYANKFMALMGSMNDGNKPATHSPILHSQSLWDATMAYSIAERLQKKFLIIHLNGGFHTESRLGTVEHLLKYKPKAKVLVVTMRYEDDFKNFNKEKHTGLGDFIILTDSKGPKSQK